MMNIIILALLFGQSTVHVGESPSESTFSRYQAVAAVTNGTQLVAELVQKNGKDARPGAAKKQSQTEISMVGPSEPVLIKLTLRNFGSALITVADAPARDDFQVDVRSQENGRTVLTSYGRWILELSQTSDGFGRIKTFIKGRQEAEDFLLVNRTHDMTKNGNYFVTVKRRVVPATGDPYTVTSNTVTVQVQNEPAHSPVVRDMSAEEKP